MAHKIIIDDLAQPQRTEAQILAIDQFEANPVELSEPAILDGAREQTGLDDFGPSDFKARLKLLLDEWNSDVSLTQFHRNVLLDMARRFASTRLLAMDFIKQHPGVRDEVIDRPIIVVGLPRSGTTHLLNLLAADSRLRSLPLWEACEPLPNPLEPAREDGVDPRYARCAARWERAQVSSPLTAAMHPMNPDHFHEDLELMAPDFSSYHFEWMSRVPGWRDHHYATDQTRGIL